LVYVGHTQVLARHTLVVCIPGALFTTPLYPHLRTTTTTYPHYTTYSTSPPLRPFHWTTTATLLRLWFTRTPTYTATLHDHTRLHYWHWNTRARIAAFTLHCAHACLPRRQGRARRDAATRGSAPYLPAACRATPPRQHFGRERTVLPLYLLPAILSIVSAADVTIAVSYLAALPSALHSACLLTPEQWLSVRAVCITPTHHSRIAAP